MVAWLAAQRVALVALVSLMAGSVHEAPAQELAPAGEELLLDGVIVAANPAHSVALVRRAGAARARVLRIGQGLHGYVLLEVTKGSVRLEGRTGELRLFLSGEGAASSVALPRPELPRDAAAPEEGWIRRAFGRAKARERLSREFPVILKETDLSPRVEDGEVRGLSVARLPDGTLLSEWGLLPGDVLVSINGEPLLEVDALWELVARLADEDEIRVVVRRRGEVLRLAYAFTN